MINNTIGNKSDKNDEKTQEVKKKPDENSCIHFSSHIKIYDPNSKEVYVQKRADD